MANPNQLCDVLLFVVSYLHKYSNRHARADNERPDQTCLDEQTGNDDHG